LVVQTQIILKNISQKKSWSVNLYPILSFC